MLSRDDLWSLEEYAVHRNDFRSQVMAHKKHRHISLGEHVRVLFEDATTIKYQIQEMLRVERIFEPAGIQEELDAYNPLIPNGSNLKATLMFEFSDVAQRKQMLARLIGAENKVWLKVADHEPVYGIADEDLDRATADKTSSVHFLRFEFSTADVAAFKSGERVMIGLDSKWVTPDNRALTQQETRALSMDFQAPAMQ